MSAYSDPEHRRDARAYKRAYGSVPTPRELASFRKEKALKAAAWNEAYDIADERERASGRKPPKRPKSLRKVRQK